MLLMSCLQGSSQVYSLCGLLLQLLLMANCSPVVLLQAACVTHKQGVDLNMPVTGTCQSTTFEPCPLVKASWYLHCR